MSTDVLVVGAGMGGLAAAIDIAAAGWRVTLVDAQPTVGGKARAVHVGGYPVDAGPTVLTMRWVFDELFARSGADFGASVQLEQLDVLARHRWVDGSQLDLWADRQRSVDAIGEFAGVAAAEGYERFLDYAAKIYSTVEAPFIRGQRPTPWTIARDYGFAALPMALRIDGWRKMWHALGKFFIDPRLRQLFARYATYAGNSPFLAPATFNLIAHVEAAGVWRPVGGMRAVALAMADLARRNGVQMRLGEMVASIDTRKGRATGVTLASGEHIAANSLIFGGDVAALASGRLGSLAQRSVPTQPATNRSLSALTWCCHARVDGWPLAHHNVVFGDSYAEEFDAIFQRRRLPDTPTTYVCAQDVGAGFAAHEDRQRLLILVNAPAVGDHPPEGWSEEVQRCEQRTFKFLQECGLQVEQRPAQVRTAPEQWEALFPASGGGLYGQAAHHWTANLRRMGARSRIDGLYLCGGSTHPGAGVPMAALSGTLACQQLLADRRLTALSLPAATPGGIATSSATTAPAT